MAFRDDRKALREKLEATQRELAESEREREELEEELEETREELAEASVEPPADEPRNVPGPKPASNQGAAVAVVAVGLIALVAVLAALTSGSRSDDTWDETVVPDDPYVLDDPLQELGDLGGGTGWGDPDLDRQIAELSHRRLPVEPTWAARVTASDDPEVEAGRECELEVTAGFAVLPSSAALTCGAGTVLFFGTIADERDGADETACQLSTDGDTPALTCETESGDRIDTAAHTAILTSDNGWRVEVELGEITDLGRPSSGEPAAR